MSMINDALRRASSAGKTVPGDKPLPPAIPPISSTPLPPMPVVETTPPLPPLMPGAGESSSFGGGLDSQVPAPPVMRVEPARRSSSLPIVFVTLFVFCVAGAAAAYFWQSKHVVVKAIEKTGKEQRFAQETSSPRGDIQAEKRAAVSNGVDGRSSVVVAGPAKSGPPPIGTAVAAAPPSASLIPPTQPPVAVKFPLLRLQSIFFRPANPSVIINGKTLFIADEINGVKVADIQPANVTLVLSGQTNVLTLR